MQIVGYIEAVEHISVSDARFRTFRRIGRGDSVERRPTARDGAAQGKLVMSNDNSIIGLQNVGWMCIQ
jgi:hypothetical protein